MSILPSRLLRACRPILFLGLIASCAELTAYTTPTGVPEVVTLASAAPAMMGKGVIRGVVTREGLQLKQADTGQGVPGARVLLESYPDITTYTDPDGRFELMGVPDGLQYIVAELRTPDGLYKVRKDVQITQEVPLVDLSSLVLRRSGSLVGKITVSDGANPFGADVFVAGTTIVGKAKDSGAFALVEMAAGTYPVSVTLPGYGRQTKIVNITPGQTVSLDFQLKRAQNDPALATLRGKVIDQDGHPISGVTVSVLGGSTTLSAEDGSYQLGDIAIGIADLRFHTAGQPMISTRVTVSVDEMKAGHIQVPTVRIGALRSTPSAAAATETRANPLEVPPLPPAGTSPARNTEATSPSSSSFPNASPKPSPLFSVTPPVEYLAETTLSGSITNDIRLGPAGTRYTLGGLVQIGAQATVWIEPGVTLEGGGQSIELLGTLAARGTAVEPVSLTNVRIVEGKSGPKRFDIRYVRWTGGKLQSVFGSGDILDSTLKGVDQLYHYVNGPCLFARNVIENCGKITINVQTGGSVTLTNNVVAGTTQLATSMSRGPIVATHNSLLATESIRIETGYSTDATIQAERNYWGSTEASFIESRIRDANDDLNATSRVAYNSPLSAPHPDTPAYAWPPPTAPAPSPSPDGSTALQGPLAASVTLQAKATPYQLKGALQVGQDATLTLGPGVVLDGNGLTMELLGRFVAQGTTGQPVIIRNLKLVEGKSGPKQVELRFTRWTGGSVSLVYSTGGTVADSSFSSVSQLYHYVRGPWFFARNQFKDCGKMTLNVDTAGSVSFENNALSGTSRLATTMSRGPITATLNSFLGSEGVRVENGYTDNAVIQADRNYWGSTDLAQIQQRIWDRSDDLNVTTAVPFEPFLTAPDANTPSPL